MTRPLDSHSSNALPPFEGNPMKTPPPGALLRVWSQAGGFMAVGRFDGDRFVHEDRRCTEVGCSYCRIEHAETGEVYYDNGWYR